MVVKIILTNYSKFMMEIKKNQIIRKFSLINSLDFTSKLFGFIRDQK